VRARARALEQLGAVLRSGPDLGAAPLPQIEERHWPAILTLANEHLLTPTLHRALKVHRAELPPEVWTYLEYLHVMNSRRNRFVHRQALELIGGLNEAGITPMILKGALMVLSDARVGRATRMMADIDVVVPHKSKAAALAVLDKLGYRMRSAYPEGHHAAGEFARDGSPAAVDLHFELVDQRYVLPANEVWRFAIRAETTAGGVYLMPSPTFRALHNIIHAQVHYLGGFYRGDLDLRQLYELAYLTSAYRGRIDWTYIRDRMKRYHLSTALQSYLINLGQFMGTPWPISDAPSPRAQLHAWRCRFQHCNSLWRNAAVPWGNLRAAFAWHRMESLYGWTGGGPLAWRYNHLRDVLAHHPASFVLDKLFHF
jgi:hypothetical protein